MNTSVRLATTADAHAIATIHIRSWASSFEGCMRAEWLAEKTQDVVVAEWLNTLRGDPACVYVAVDSPSYVVGFICSGRTGPSTLPGYDSEILSIHVSPTAKRAGHGRRLMDAAFKRLASLGSRNVMLWTLEANRTARDFYERLGGHVKGAAMKEFAGVSQPVIAYGWNSLSFGG